MRAAGAINIAEEIPEDELERFTMGEIADLILQAGCRGVVRRSVKGGCPSARLFVIADPRRGIADAARWILPNCKASRWCPVLDYAGKIGEAVRWLEDWQRRSNEGDQVSFRNMAKQLGLRSKELSNIRRSQQFRDAMNVLGIDQFSTNGKYRTHLVVRGNDPWTWLD